MGKYSETRYANMIPTFEPAPLPASEAATAQKSNMRVYETFAALPATSTSKGNTAFVKATNKLYVWNGVGWYIVAEVTNASPSSITGVNASYDLASDGTATTITAVATDPEGFALTWSSSVTAGSLNGTTVSNVDNVFTITPHASNATTFTITFSVTDGVNSAVSYPSAFTLTFGWGSASHQQTLVPSIGTNTFYSNNAYARIGSSVAIDGDTLVVGGWGFAGHVWVFTRSGNTWTEQQQLVASDQANGDEFGYAVDISGDTIIIGARQEEADGSNHGSVYIFNRSGTTWSQESKLYPSNMQTGYTFHASNNTSSVYFGADVAIDGDDIIIGMPNYDVATSTDNRGGSVTLRRIGTSVTNTLGANQWRIRTVTGGSGSDNTGEYVDICKDSNGKPVIAISMNKRDTYASDAGYIAIYKMNSGNSLYSYQEALVPSDIQASDQVGRPDLDYYNGSYTLAVGVPYEDTGATNAGAVYIFTSTTGESGTWSQQQKIQASSVGNTDYFGVSVSVNGDSLVVGAHRDDDTVTDAGAFYIFERTGTTWTQATKLQAPTPEGSGTFGRAVAMDGDYIVVGARDNPLTATLSGASYVYTK